MADRIFIFEVADQPVAKGRIVGVYSSADQAQRAATRFQLEVTGDALVPLSWSRWFGEQLVAEVERFPLAGVIRPCVFRISPFAVDQDLAAPDAAALALPSEAH